MDRSLWSYRELTAALSLPRAAGPDVRGIAIDSRLTEPGDLFVALPGDPGPRFQATSRSDRDGHDFVPHAVENGALSPFSCTATWTRPTLPTSPNCGSRTHSTGSGPWAGPAGHASIARSWR